MADSVSAAGSLDQVADAVVPRAVVPRAVLPRAAGPRAVVPRAAVPMAPSAAVARAGVAQAVGAYGERLAARYLVDSGMQILDRNWRCLQGEIDIVAMDGACLVIVEVKTRRTLSFGSPVEAVTAVKAARLRRLAGCWLTEHRFLVGSVADVRVDVIGVLRPLRQPAQVEHLVGVAP